MANDNKCLILRMLKAFYVIVLVICDRTLKVIDGIALNEMVCDKIAHFIN
jgi:hypothetical protein